MPHIKGKGVLTKVRTPFSLSGDATGPRAQAAVASFFIGSTKTVIQEGGRIWKIS